MLWLIVSTPTLRLYSIVPLFLLLGSFIAVVNVPASFLGPRARRVDIVLGCSAAAIIADLIGMTALHSYVAGKGTNMSSGSGYLLTVLSLTAAAGCCVAAKIQGGAWGRKIVTSEALPSGQGGPLRRGSSTSDPDIAFWDGIADKSDPDSLHEYLLRFPAGRFRQLAQAKLERQAARRPEAQDDALSPLTAAQTPASMQVSCPRCGATWADDDRFCAECGEKRP